MRNYRRRRLAIIAAASLALHAAMLVWLAWPRSPDFFPNGPDLSLMSVELLAPTRSEPSQKTRRQSASAATARVAAPAPVAMPAESDLPPAASAPAEVAPAQAGAVSSERLRAALRTGGGCTRARSREEREACEERLGRLNPGAPSYDAPMDPGKRAYYDAVVAAGPAGGGYGDPQPAAVTPNGAAYFRGINCSIQFGAGKRRKDHQGEVKLDRSPCSIPLQGSFVTPEASVRKH